MDAGDIHSRRPGFNSHPEPASARVLFPPSSTIRLHTGHSGDEGSGYSAVVPIDRQRVETPFPRGGGIHISWNATIPSDNRQSSPSWLAREGHTPLRPEGSFIWHAITSTATDKTERTRCNGIQIIENSGRQNHKITLHIHITMVPRHVNSRSCEA